MLPDPLQYLSISPSSTVLKAHLILCDGAGSAESRDFMIKNKKGMIVAKFTLKLNKIFVCMCNFKMA
jgi:hypothetical protein